MRGSRWFFALVLAAAAGALAYAVGVPYPVVYVVRGVVRHVVYSFGR